MNSHLDTIHSRVRALQRRIILILLLEGLCIVGAAWLLLWIIGPLPLGIVKGWPGMIWRVLVLAAAGGTLILVFARIIFLRDSDDGLALRIEKVYPELNNSLISSLQLSRESSSPDPRHRFSGFLLDRLVRHTAGSMHEIDISRVADLEKLKWMFWFFCLALISAILIHNFLPGYLGNSFSILVLSEFRVQDDKDSSRMALSAQPLTTGDFNLNYVYPEYSGLEPQTVRHSSGEISALKGTEVRIQTTCLEKVASANLVIHGSGRIPMDVDDEERLSGKLVVSEPGEYFIEADDTGDVHRAEVDGHPIHVEDDLYPEISLSRPIADLEVNAEDMVELVYEAGDDFGVGRVSLVFHQGMQEKRVVIFRPSEDANKRHKGEYNWDLSTSGVEPGDRVSFYLEVEDNDNISGPKKSRSATIHLEVFSALKKHEEVIVAQEELLEEMIENLALHLEDSPNHESPPAGYKPKDVEDNLIRKSRELLAHIGGVLEMMESDDYSSDLVRESLENMVNSYQGLLDSRDDMAGRLTPNSRLSKGLLGLRAEYIGRLEGDIIFLDRMIKKQRLDWVVMEGKNLARAQQELAELLEKYKASGDPALLEELQRKMAELEAAFYELMDRMARMRKEMGDEFFNPEAFEGPEWKDIFEQMARMRNTIQDGDLSSALAQAESFLDALGQMMAALEERAGEYGDMVSAEALRRMDEAIEMLARLESMEQDLIDRSEDMYHRRLERAAEMESILDPFIMDESKKIDELIQKLAQLQREVRSLAPERVKARHPEEIRNRTREFYQRKNSLFQQTRDIQSHLARRKEELESGELDRMLEQMRLNQSMIELTRKDLEALFEQFGAEPEKARENASSRCEEAQALGQEIIEDIEGMREYLRSALVAPDAEKLESMAEEQEGVREQTLKVQEDIDDLAREVPAIPSGTMEKLDMAALSMRDASGYLLLDEPGGALTHEREAKLKLKQAREDLVQAQKQLMEMAGPGGGFPMGLGGALARGGGRGGEGLTMKEFKLPEAGTEDDPGEFREALLKAMRESAPEEYRNLNHDYYERLMR